MQSAAMLSLFCPLLPTTLNKRIAQTPRNSCSFCYSGVFHSLAVCLAAMFFLFPPPSLKINVSAPRSTSCNSLTESPADINPVSLQHASHDPLLACKVCLGTPPPLLQLFSSFLCNSTRHFVSPFIDKLKQLLPRHTYIICSL